VQAQDAELRKNNKRRSGDKENDGAAPVMDMLGDEEDQDVIF